MTRPRSGIVVLSTSDLSVDSQLKGQLAVLHRTVAPVLLVTHDTGRLSHIQVSDGVDVERIAFRRDPAPLHDLFALIRVVALLLRRRPQMVIAGTPKASLLGMLAAFVTRVPRRIYFLYGIRAETASGAGRRMLLAMEGLTVRLSTTVLSVGRGLTERASSLGIPTKSFRLVGAGSANGIDFSRFSMASDANAALRERHRDALRWESREVVIGFVGRVTVDKGIETLLVSAAALRSEGVTLRVVLVGRIEAPESFSERLTELLNQSWVTLRPEVSDTAPEYAAFDVFCLASRREGLPTVLLEAAAAGVPIVATDATGVRDVITDGHSGWVVPIDDAGALTRALREAIVSGAESSRRARRAAESVAEHFDQRQIWRSLAEFYRDQLRN